MSARAYASPVPAERSESEPHRSAYLNPAADDCGPDELWGDHFDRRAALTAAYEHLWAGNAAGAAVARRYQYRDPSGIFDQLRARARAAERKRK